MALSNALTKTLTISAGRRVRQSIRADGGLDPARIRLMVGASGGPKWLALSRLDRAILRRWICGRSAPLDLLASSIGTWRFACYAQPDPLGAFDRMEEAYLAYAYKPGDTAEDITRDSYAILDKVFGQHGAQAVFQGPMRLSVMAVRGRHILNSDKRVPLGAGLMAAAMGNLVSRKSLGLFFERALFSDPRSDISYADWTGFPMHRLHLSPGNIKSAIMASCAIPFVLNGIANIPGAPAGLYRDGGIIDYHFDLPYLQQDPDGIVLYPHFFDQLIPGWFDKPLLWRRARMANLDNVLLIAPSASFISSLPYGKIPDRKDFTRFSLNDRLTYWRRVLAETDRLAEAFEDIVEHGLLPDVVKPLGA